ncbi:MAG: ATP-binding cassette domain-containing protein [Pseudomonadota bacterium]
MNSENNLKSGGYAHEGGAVAAVPVEASTTSGFEPGPTLGPAQDDAERVLMADRGTPRWARPVALFFALGTEACLVAIAVIAVLFQALVAEQGERLAAPLLLAVAFAPIVGLLVLEYAYARALAGFRAARGRAQTLARAGVAAFLTLALAVLHPLLAVPILAVAALGWGAIHVAGRWGRREPLWDFRPSEAAAILSGRDKLGLTLAARGEPPHALLPQVRRAFGWLALMAGFAMATYLSSTEVIAVAAAPSLAIMSYWLVSAALDYAILRSTHDSLDGTAEATVRYLPQSEAEWDEAGASVAGLQVVGLSVSDGRGRALISDISFEVAPGEIIGVLGEAAAGKSLLMEALVNPFDLGPVAVEGRVSFHGTDLWDRSVDLRAPEVVHVPAVPRVLPASGLDNLTCFHGADLGERGRRCLESLVFSDDTVERITAAPDATTLSSRDQKALSLARAILLAPACYLLDRPEDCASDKLIAALIDRIKMEARAGRSFVIVTDNRAVLETCDKLLQMRGGRLVDFAPAGEMRGRMSSGWLRFVAARRLESEDTLTNWLRSHFKRNGDEANRRKLCMVGAELLAVSCHGVRPMSNERICFDFKHFEGHAILKLTDDAPLLSSGQMQIAHREAENPSNARRSALAKVIAMADTVEQTLVENRRVLTIKVATYDPRKSGGMAPPEAIAEIDQRQGHAGAGDAAQDAGDGADAVAMAVPSPGAPRQGGQVRVLKGAKAAKDGAAKRRAARMQGRVASAARDATPGAETKNRSGAGSASATGRGTDAGADPRNDPGTNPGADA